MFDIKVTGYRGKIEEKEGYGSLRNVSTFYSSTGRKPKRTERRGSEKVISFCNGSLVTDSAKNTYKDDMYADDNILPDNHTVKIKLSY